MKIETHAHTKEGSIDGRVTIEDTIKELMRKGYDGMIVTDHNSYDGYYSTNNDYENFRIIKGVEYDTSDGGHMLIVLPVGADKEGIFTHKGMSLKDTVNIVHRLGGIIGPAHPFDYYRLGLMNNGKWIKHVDIIKEFDFIEEFNSCGTRVGSRKSNTLARAFDKPSFGGSDSHRIDAVGKAYTILPEFVNNEDELISLVKRMSYGDTKVFGEYSDDKASDKLGFIYDLGVKLFYGIGRASSLVTRRKALKVAMSLSLI